MTRRGEVDGLVGPKTREALAAYQTDHELEVTSAVDEPTVEALGLIQNAWSCAPVVGDWRNL
ncbi:MAG: peptidoglycan-binding protein [Chthoniobacterales bacterium]|nr:peptidoglycan-binding protein [Chthoniobacterales bacterium]